MTWHVPFGTRRGAFASALGRLRQNLSVRSQQRTLIGQGAELLAVNDPLQTLGCPDFKRRFGDYHLYVCYYFFVAFQHFVFAAIVSMGTLIFRLIILAVFTIVS